MNGLRIGGHPVHPMLVHFPVTFWTVALAAELTGWLTSDARWWQCSFYSQAIGAALALVAMIAGLMDYASVPRDHRAQSTAVRHMIVMCTAWLLFIVSLLLRGRADAHSIWATLIAVLGFATLLYGGWLGGRLVYRFGIGVAASE
jgi:uncharacterized membrane protein